MSRTRIRALSFWIALGLCGSATMVWASEAKAQSIQFYASKRDFNLKQGASVSSNLTIYRYGYTGPVNFEVVGGNGIVGTFSANPITGNSAKVTFKATTARVGYQSLVVRAIAGNSVQQQPFDFNITRGTPTTSEPTTPVPLSTVSPSSLTFSAVAGTSSTAQNVTIRNSGTGPLNISSVNVGGANASLFNFASNACSGATLAAGASCTSSVRFAGTATTGTYSAQLAVSSNATTNPSVGLTATVAAPQPAGSYTLGLSSSAVTLTQGQSSSVTVNLARTNFTNSVALSIAGYPGGMTPTFSPSSTTGNSVTLNLPTTTSTVPGPFTATVTAVGGGITRTANLNITVNAAPVAAPNFTLSIPTSPLSIRQPAAGAANNTGSFTVNAVRTNLPDALNFTVSGAPSGVTVSCPPTALAGLSTTCTVNVTPSAAVSASPSTLNVQSTAAGITRSATIALSVTAIPATPPAATGLKAFPSAEGFGAISTSGGRGGQVCKVTTLSRTGTGSLQSCMDIAGPTYIVFNVSGVIDGGVIECHQGNKTIAGHTSPAGITIRGFEVDNVYESNPNCQNMIVRHLRSRPALDERSTSGWMTGDGMRLDGTRDWVLDHMSFARAQDEALQISRITNLTVQNTSFAETLSDHFWGGILVNYSNQGKLLAGKEVGDLQNLSFHHNTFNRMRARFPEISCEENGDANSRLGASNCSGKRLKVELSNNLIFDPVDPVWYNKCTGTNAGSDCATSVSSNFMLDMNYVGNRTITRWDRGMLGNDLTANPNNDFYIADNFYEEVGVGQYLSLPTNADRFDYPEISYTDVDNLENYMIQNVGAFPRDAMDQRLAAYLNKDISTVPAYVNSTSTDAPILQSARVGDTFTTLSASCAVPADSDNDGMPDAWETKRGLNPNSANHNGTDLSSEGYTNIEMYLEELNNQVVARGSSTTALCDIANW